MASWRKNQGISNSQGGNRRSSSYYGKPPLDNRFSTVPLWEKKFCTTVGAVSWGRLLEGKRYMESHSDVMKWDDSAAKQAFHDAKNRFWADINGFCCDIPLPDPDMYIDEVDWDACVDHELYLDLDREEEARDKIIEKSQEETVIVDNYLGNWELTPTGWGDEEEEVTKPQEPSYGAEGWGSSNHENQENNETNSCEQNDSQRWIPKEQYGGELHEKYQTPNVENKNWGGYNKKRENNISWSKNHAYQHYNNDYKMNRGRGNGGRGGGCRGRKGNCAYVAKVATPNSR
ncbi:uncharacterized protein LOC131614873 [Vicia villosa]|uniref:uncharacterized protein LOC131614873 n=1 Tax=Vicia villosa TaxID=3911 RepID=UPI00273C4ED8|nr:uncharacterized protein LOC131614873 [Vicia villosa]